MRELRFPMRRRMCLSVLLTVAFAGFDTANADPNAKRRIETGSLESGDIKLPSGEYYDEYDITGSQGEVVILELHSADYDAFVQMSPSDQTGPNSELVWHNNDAETTSRDARLAVSLPADGEYDIFVTSSTADETGRYELSITVLPQPDRTEAGRLTEDDRMLDSGEYCDYYDFEARRGELWVVDVIAPEMDTYVFARCVDDPEFKVDNDDMLGEPRHSQVVFAIPRDGKYFVGVTSSRPGDTGDYVVAISSTTAIAPPEIEEPGLIRQGARGIGLIQILSSISAPAPGDH